MPRVETPLLAVLVTLLFCSEIPAQPSPLLSHVEALARHDADGRRDYLTGCLKKAGANPTPEEYIARHGIGGKNVVCTFGSVEPGIVVSARFDRIRISPGANANASGCAVLLELARRLCARDTDTSKRHRRVDVVFLDQGLDESKGATGYLSKRRGRRILAALNLDLVGQGLTPVFSPARPKEDRAITVARALKSPANGKNPRFLVKGIPSDHVAFRAAGVDAVTMNLMPEEEIAGLEAWIHRTRLRRAPLPPFLTLARGPRDVVSNLSEESLQLATTMAWAWLQGAAALSDSGCTVVPDYGELVLELAGRFREGTPTGLSDPRGKHVSLMELVGPKGIFAALDRALEDGGESAWPNVQSVLQTSFASAGLRTPLAPLMELSDLLIVREELGQLYLAHRETLVWDPNVHAVRIRDG